MRKLLEYLRLVLFVGGVLVGIQVPGYVDQYGKRLESHMLESKISLTGFQRDADKYFSGDVQKLIKHYQTNGDEVVKDGGRSINNLYQRNQLLVQAWERFNASNFSPYVQSFVRPMKDISAETWASYSFSIILDIGAILWGLSIGLALSMMVELVLGGLKLIFIRPVRRASSH